LLDAVGEFRRMALNCLRRGEVRKAEKLLGAMEGIIRRSTGSRTYIDHSTFRVKMDADPGASSNLLEAMLVTEVRRFALEQSLDRLERRLEWPLRRNDFSEEFFPVCRHGPRRLVTARLVKHASRGSMILTSSLDSCAELMYVMMMTRFCCCCHRRRANTEIIEIATTVDRVSTKYVPVFLGSEKPLLVRIAEKLRVRPDVFLIDGQGVAHREKFGLACHVGLALNRPTNRSSKVPLVRKIYQGKILDPGGEMIGRILNSRQSKILRQRRPTEYP